MTQSKTSLILNNLVELTIPTCTDSKYLTFYENKEMGFLCVKICFPFTFLLQKVQLEESNQESAKLFNIEMITKHAVTHGQMRTIVHETEIIDFKKEKIDWRFKTRMRSNSNEFLDSPLAFVQKMPKSGDGQYLPATATNIAQSAAATHKQSLPQAASQSSSAKRSQEPADSEDLSILSSDEEFELKQDGKIILGNGISNQFTLYLSKSNSSEGGGTRGDEEELLTPSSNGSKSQLTLAKLLEKFRLGHPSVRLFVWPTFRLPTGSSVIALINTSFLFATKRLEQERLEADFLVALSLISGRKFIQASEKLRKIQTCLLSHQVSVKTLIQAMNIEMIIGESMNQHSQISEKMFAFQRAVLFYKLAKRVEKHEENKGPGETSAAAASIVDIEQIINARSKSRLKQEEAYKYLLQLQPHLVQVLLMNIDSHVQAVRMASLKTLEFLFDTLGCNLDESLLQILVAIIKTYPSMTKRSNVPKDGKVISFFEDSWQLSSPSDSSDHSGARAAADFSSGGVNQHATRSSLHRFSPEQLGDPSQYSTFFSLNDIHSLKDCQVKDASLFHQSFIQTSKNFYNHILESLVFLIGSTSTPILVRIFNEIISRVLFQESIEPDLQIYLLRLSERILTLCQGYVMIKKPFLNTLFELILSKNSAEVTGMTARGLLASTHHQAGPGEDSIAKVANDLWQTLKSSYLLNQSCDGITDFIQWVVLQFHGLTEKVTSTSTSGSSNKDTNSDFATGGSHDFHHQPSRTQAQLRDATLSVIDQQKLLLLIDLSNLLIYGQLKQMKDSPQYNQNKRKGNKRNLQKIAGRETVGAGANNAESEAGGSDAGGNYNPLGQQQNENMNMPARQSGGQPKRTSSQFKLIALKMCQLMDPVIFWLNFTIERPDRLQYFKALWNMLTKLVQIIPKRKEIGIEFNCIQIILPTLQRVENFCKTSSPSLEMLQFLIVVFSDIKSFLLSRSRKRIKKELFSFLESFITTFSHNIPHNLHDEVFEVCSLLIDLAGCNGLLSQKHIREILEALVHKYTMRSKAHKRLSDQFLQTWILNHSLAQFEDLKKLEYQLVDQQYLQQQQIHQVTQQQQQQQQQSTRLRTNSNQIISSSRPHLHQQQQQNPQSTAMQQFAAQQQQQQDENNRGGDAPVENMQNNNNINNNNSLSDEDLVDLNQQQQFIGYQQTTNNQAQQQQQQQHTGSMDSLNEQQLQQEMGAMANGAAIGHQAAEPQRSNSQPSNFLRHANLAAPISANSINENNESTQANENGSNRVNNLLIEQQQIQQHLNEVQAKAKTESLYFDTLCEFSLFQNFLPSSDQFMSEQDQEQIYFEKLSILQDLIEALKEEHNSLFKRLLHHKDFNSKVAAIFSNDRARSKIIKLMKSMTGYFIKYNSPKTFYEHPIVQNSEMPLTHIGGQPQVQPQQTSARQFQGNVIERAPGAHSTLQFGHQLHSEPSLDLLRVMSQEDDVVGPPMNNNQGTEHGAIINDRIGDQLHTSTQEHQIREQDLNLQRLNHHYSQHVERQQNFLFNFNQNEAEEGESPRLAPSNMNMYLFDEVNLINNERLILIKTYTILIRILMEQLSCDSSHQQVSGQGHHHHQGSVDGPAGKDSQSQLQALNMMDMLLFSLCPMPTFQNTVIRNLLNPENMPLQGGVGLNNNNAATTAANNAGGNEFPYQISQPHRLSFQFTGLNSMLGSQMGISNNYEHQNDAIPDFETMLICDNQGGNGLSETLPQIEPNSFPKEFECWDLRYQHSRLALAFKVWPFVENAMLSSSWNNIKAACYSVLSKVVQIPDVMQMSANYQKRLKELLFPLLNKLLKSQESEGKAAGLNILGSFCGLSSFQAQSYKQSFEFSRNADSTYAEIDAANQSHSQNNAVFDSEQGQDYHYDRYEQRQKEALTRNQIKLKDHLLVFRRNSQFVSLAIWQQVFEMQDDWNEQIKDAAEVLTQLCAPKDSVKHFKKISEEKYQLHVCEAQNQLKHLYSTNKYQHFSSRNKAGANGQIGGVGNHAHLSYAGATYTQANSLQGGIVRTQFNSQSLVNGIPGLNAEMLYPNQNSQQQLLSAHAGGGGILGTQGAFSQTAVQFNQDFNLMNDAVQPISGRGGATNSQKPGLADPNTNFQPNKKMIESSSSESDEDSDDDFIAGGEEPRDSDIFFMEHYSERQLQQAISIFTSDFKPITGLQAERTALSSRVRSSKHRNLNFFAGQTSASHHSLANSAALLGHEDDYLLFGGGDSNPLIDFFEDNMLEEVYSMDSKEDEDNADGVVGKGNKESNQNSGAMTSADRHQTTSQSDGEDLGIIDLDKQEGSEYDDFDQLDDEKLPVLKNTYSKKNRPNNSKSVAIGSRSQGDVLRIRSQALQVLKAADEEIKVQIKEHPEMLSSLQRSFASQKSHEKNIFKIDLLHDRKAVKRCLDDQNLHYWPESHEWLSSKPESADRIQKKRRIQSGKATSCLSEDQPSRGQNNSGSQYSKTNSSSGRSMEIGDIQIVMHQQQQQRGMDFGGFGGGAIRGHRQRNQGEKVIDRGLFNREKRISDDHHEIRSQDNKNKRKTGKRSQKKVQMNRVGDLSENDCSEKVSSSDQDVQDRAHEEYEVISAPVQRTTPNDIRGNRYGGGACSSAYKLSMQNSKISIDSLTELSSPYDEGSSSNKTLPPSANKNEEEESKRKSVNRLKIGKSNHMTSKGTAQDGGSMQAKGSQQISSQNKKPYQTSMHKVSLQQPPSHGSSNYLQTVVANNKQQLVISQKSSGTSGVSGQMLQQPQTQKSLSMMNKMQQQQMTSSHQSNNQANQKFFSKEVSARSKHHQAQQQHHTTAKSSNNAASATFNQSQLKLIQGNKVDTITVIQTQVALASTDKEHHHHHTQPNSSKMTPSAGQQHQSQKPLLNSVHSQQVFKSSSNNGNSASGSQQPQQQTAHIVNVAANHGQQQQPTTFKHHGQGGQPSIHTNKSSGAAKKSQTQGSGRDSGPATTINKRPSAPNQTAVIVAAHSIRDKRPNSLVVKHMPSQHSSQVQKTGTTSMTTTKRNNFIVQSSPRDGGASKATGHKTALMKPSSVQGAAQYQTHQQTTQHQSSVQRKQQPQHMQLQTKQGGAAANAEQQKQLKQQTKMTMSQTSQQRPPAGRLEVMPANDGDLDEEDGDEEAEVDEDEEDEEALIVEEFDDPVVEDIL